MSFDLQSHIYAEMSEWFKEHDWKSCDWGDWSGGSNPLLCANKETPFLGCFFVGKTTIIEEDLRDELPFKKSINNAFQGRDEQTHKVGVCGDRAQRKPHFAREEPFCGSKMLCLDRLRYDMYHGKGDN